MTLEEIAKILTIDEKYHALPIKNFQIDSRLIEPGDIFIAIKDKRDGHDFLNHAESKGAIAAIVSQEIKSSSLPLMYVPDSLEALTKIASHCRQKFKGYLIAITGSTGKTTVKEMIANILKLDSKTLYSHKSFNNHLGVPLTLCRLNNSYKFAVIELGANHLGEIKKLSNLTSPNMAIINNISEAHIAEFGSFQNIILAKSEIFSGVKPKGIGIINQQTKEITEQLKQAASHLEVVSFSLKEGDIHAENINTTEKASSFSAFVHGEKIDNIWLNMPGIHNIENALSSICATYKLVSKKNIIKGLKSAQSIPGRLKSIELSNNIQIIDDTYNASPNSVTNAIKYLSTLIGKKILVLGEMSELGNRSEYHHAQMGLLAKSLGIDQVYTFGEAAKIVCSNFGDNSKHFSSQDALKDYLIHHIHDNTHILIKGSRKTKMENISSSLVQYFS